MTRSIVPAILPASRKDLVVKLDLLASIEGVARVQIDVVDGLFAGPATWPYCAPGELAEMANLPHLDRIEYEIDLMSLDAEDAAEAWLALGATRFTFHAEGIPSLAHFLARVRARYAGDDLTGLLRFGLALNASTPLALIEPYLREVDYVQCMGIATIGRQGEPFDRRAIERVRTLRARYADLPIQVDGGVSLSTAHVLLEAGANDLIAGSAILRAARPAEAFKQLRNA